MFYDKVVEIITEGEGHKDDKGRWVEGELVRSTAIHCDIQPIKNETALKDYGMDVKEGYEMYCTPIKTPLVGKKVIHNEKIYKIVACHLWDNYHIFLLERYKSTK